MTEWRPTANHTMLQERARLLGDIRAFFAARDVLEVDVPVLSRATVTDPHIESLVVSSPLDARDSFYLMTSPEFYMKRLLAAGSGPVYYLGPAFRAGDYGSRHQPEFTILEWYRPGWTISQLMDEVAALVNDRVAGDVRETTYRQSFLDYAGLDPHRAGLMELRALAHSRLSPAFDSDDRYTWLDLLFSHLVEPQLSGKVLVTEFPAAQAALAQTAVDAEGNAVALRFELYIDGIEIANGYQEELDASVLAARFADNLGQRAVHCQAMPPIDEQFLAAMQAGLPACAGVALGVDRLLMVETGSRSIRDVVPFALG